jgi:hypothetical protein
MVLFRGRDGVVLETRFIFPHIYYLMKPNVVFVYKILTYNYLNVSDLGSQGWETFELNHGETLETFDHQKYRPLEGGRSYFIQQDDLNLMVQEINKQIHIYRKRQSNEVQLSPVHIVTPEFAAGSLRLGLERPKIVIGFPDFFAIGPLWKLDEKIGQTYRNEWFYENINDEQDDYEYETKFQNTLREINDLPNDVPIYLWCGQNACEQIGVRFILYLLREKGNNVYLLNSTELYVSYLNGESVNGRNSYTGQLEPEELRVIFEKNKGANPLSITERHQFQKEWELLSQTQEVLRIWENGKIISVAENHFDSLIIDTVKGLHSSQGNLEFIKVGTVVGELLALGANCDGHYLEYRIRKLVYNGELTIKGIPKSMRHYSVKMRDNSAT